MCSFSNSDAKFGQACDSNFSYIEVDNIWVNGCEYKVSICFRCAFHSPLGSIKINGYAQVDPNCIPSATDSQIQNDIYNTIFSWSFINTFICLDRRIEPCNDQPYPIIFEIVKPLCWEKLKFDGLIWYKQCSSNDNTCTEVWNYCFNTVFPNIGPIRYLISATGDPGKCPEGPVKDPVLEGIPTDCFTIPNTSECD